MRKLHLTNAKQRDATIGMLTLKPNPRPHMGLPGKNVEYRRYTGAAESGLHENLQRTLGDDYGQALVDGAPDFTAAIPACGSWLADLNEMTGHLRDDVARAQEDARRAGVLPGVVRDVLRTHRMDWGQ